MQITQRLEGQALVLELQGRFDAGTAEHVKQKLLDAIGDQAVQLIVDLAQVDYISSVGLRVLMLGAKRVAAVHGKFQLCGMRGHVRQVIDLAGFPSMIPVAATVEAALANLD
jgi:anti-anti-sigma factor